MSKLIKRLITWTPFSKAARYINSKKYDFMYDVIHESKLNLGGSIPTEGFMELNSFMSIFDKYAIKEESRNRGDLKVSSSRFFRDVIAKSQELVEIFYDHFEDNNHTPIQGFMNGTFVHNMVSNNTHFFTPASCIKTITVDHQRTIHLYGNSLNQYMRTCFLFRDVLPMTLSQSLYGKYFNDPMLRDLLALVDKLQPDMLDHGIDTMEIWIMNMVMLVALINVYA